MISKQTSIIEQLNACRRMLIEKFGDRGQQLFERTLKLLGFPEGKIDGRFLLSVNTELLPFVKTDGYGTLIGNVNLGAGEFRKIDASNRTVAGYANTIIADQVHDVLLPESYKDSVAHYGNDIYFMHRREVHGGKITKQYIDSIGWYVESAPDSDVWPLIANGKIKGYSIGGCFMFGNKIGAANVYNQRYAVKIDDLSYVSSPCNKLSFFEDKTKQDATDGRINLALLCKQSRNFSDFCNKVEDATVNPQQFTKNEHSNQVNLQKIARQCLDFGEFHERAKEAMEGT